MKTTTLTWVLFVWCIGTGNTQFDDRPPPRYSSHRMPKTRFTCEGKFTGRYYADPETDCQMFHICTRTSRRDVKDFKFLCPNGTVFDQDHQVCNDYYQVVCHLDFNSNPLEILKISSSKDNVMSLSGDSPPPDPDYYFSQNNLGNEEFQVEEYNNNKLASSRNSLPFKSSQIKGKDDTFFFTSSTTPESIPLAKEVIITSPPLSNPSKSPQPILTSRKVSNTKPITQKPSIQQSSTSGRQPNFSRKLVQMISSPPEVDDLYDSNNGRQTSVKKPKSPPEVDDIYDSNNGRQTSVKKPKGPSEVDDLYDSNNGRQTSVKKPKGPPEVDDLYDSNNGRQISRNNGRQFSAKKPKSTTTTTTTPGNFFREPESADLDGQVRKKSPSIFDEPMYRFSDFASLNKFQTQFHKSLKNGIASNVPRTTTEELRTTTSQPHYSDYEEGNNFEYTESSETTTDPNVYSTTERFTFYNYEDVEPNTRFSPFKPSTNDDFEFNSSPPVHRTFPVVQTTQRQPLFRNTFRKTFPDVTTPQTFRQQPTRFSEDFFKKVPVQKSDFFKNDDEDEYYGNSIQVTPARSTSNSRFNNRHVDEDDIDLTSTSTQPTTRYTQRTSRTTLRTTKPTQATSRATQPTSKQTEPTQPPTTTELITEKTTVRPHPQRRRRPKQNREVIVLSPLQKFQAQRSRDLENKNKSTTEKVEVKDSEIFNAEASINSASAGIQNLKNNPITSYPEADHVKATDVHDGSLDQNEPNSNERERNFPVVSRASTEVPPVGNAEPEIEKAFNRLRGQKRLRDRGNSTTKTAFVYATTYRPTYKIRPLSITPIGVHTRRLPSSSTTEEPELVTAPPEEVERLRTKQKIIRANSKFTRTPSGVSINVASRSFRTARNSSSNESNSNKSRKSLLTRRRHTDLDDGRTL